MGPIGGREEPVGSEVSLRCITRNLKGLVVVQSVVFLVSLLENFRSLRTARRGRGGGGFFIPFDSHLSPRSKTPPFQSHTRRLSNPTTHRINVSTSVVRMLHPSYHPPLPELLRTPNHKTLVDSKHQRPKIDPPNSGALSHKDLIPLVHSTVPKV